MIKKSEATRPFGSRDKIGYFLGDFGNGLLFMMTAQYLTLFYVDVIGLSAASVGTLLLLSRMWDAINDPIIGSFIDTRKRTSTGKFRRWIIIMGIPVALFGILSFVSFPALIQAPLTVKLLFAYVTYIGFGMAYTAINIPYGAMVSVMTDVSTERASLSMYRAYGSVFASLLVGVFVPMFVFDKAHNPNPQGFFGIALLLSILSLIAWRLCYHLTRERIAPISSEPQKIDLKLTLSGIAKNRSLVALLLSGFLSLMQFLTVGTITPYLFKDYFKNTSILPIIGFVSIIPLFLISPLMKPLIKLIGKKMLAVIGCFFAGIMGIIIYIVPSLSVGGYITLLLFTTAGYTFMNLLTWAFVADAIDYHEYITHKREEGIIYAIYSFSRKMGQAGAGYAGAWVLIFTGYIARAPQQSIETAQKIKEMAGLIPGILNILVALIMFFLYDLGQNKLQEVTEELRRRRSEKAS